MTETGSRLGTGLWAALHSALSTQHSALGTQPFSHNLAMPAVRKHPPRALLLWPLAMAFFFDVSGGPYGLESLMQSGPGMAILLILITPIIWSAPAALLTAE